MMTDEQDDTLAQLMGAGMLSVLDHDQTIAIRALLNTGELAPFLSAVATLADQIEDRVARAKAGNGHEPQRLPGADDDRALKEWLEREREATNAH
jgi:hypothetical protein